MINTKTIAMATDVRARLCLETALTEEGIGVKFSSVDMGWTQPLWRDAVLCGFGRGAMLPSWQPREVVGFVELPS